MKSAEEFMKEIFEKDPAHFKVAATLREMDRLGIAHPDSGGTCTADNCHGTTGCSKQTQNGYCACVNPNQCSWIPAV